MALVYPKVVTSTKVCGLEIVSTCLCKQMLYTAVSLIYFYLMPWELDSGCKLLSHKSYAAGTAI